jgi:type VII secretion-associated serine protease mycosin
LASFVVLLTVLIGSGVAHADEVRDRQWHLAFLDVAEAHKYSKGAGVTVAVIDSGVDASHPDLSGNVEAGTETYQGATGDGRSDTNGHGTAVAGLIAAHGHGPGNSAGVLGIAPMATILPIRSDVGKSSDNTAVTAGIRYAVAHGAKVICIAQGGTGPIEQGEAVEAALAAGIVIVAAAGNRPEGPPIVEFPAAFPGVVAAGGVDRNGNRAELSVTGKELVLAAPAVEIVSAKAGGGYRAGNGTSDATAIIAGAAALVRSRFPNLSGEEVVHRLTATAIDKGPPGRDDQYGYGIVNLVDALTKDVPPLHPTASPSAQAAPPRSATPAAAIIVALLLVIAVGAGGTIWLIRRQRA